MERENKLKIRARLVIIKEGKLLVTYDSKNDFYFCAGGKLEFGETLIEGCKREVREECGEDVNFEFGKILYVRDFILPEENEHSLELFILGKIDATVESLEKKIDDEFDGHKWLTWLDMNSLPQNLKPASLTSKLLESYRDGFTVQGEYVGKL
jgi:ADP-ribose pyrophosphatase YjhB (NUDIX family)